MTEATPSTRLKARIYDILSNRAKLESVAPIGALGPADSAILTAVTLAVDAFEDEAVLEMAEIAMEGVVGTLLTIYQNGLPEGATLQNSTFQKLAKILEKAGEHDRSTEDVPTA